MSEYEHHSSYIFCKMGRLCLCLLWSLSTLLSANGQESCAFYYLAQPPTELPCNPYLDTSRFSLRIECVAAVNRSIGLPTDFQIHWYAQLGSDSTPQELLLNDTSSFSVRIDQPTAETGDFYVYQSQARIADMEINVFDRFWCQIDASETIRNATNITDLERSDQTVISAQSFYISSPLPLCTQQAFFHQTSLKCANVMTEDTNNTQFEPPMSSSMIPTRTPLPSSSATTSCPPNLVGEESVRASRLLSVLLPALILPVIVAVLLVIAAIIMTCRHSGKPDRNQRGRKVNEAASGEYTTSPVRITSPTTATQTTETETVTALKETRIEKTAPPRPPPPALRPPIKIINQPPSPPPSVPVVARFAPNSPSAAVNNRFSQDVYEDITDSALDAYSMSNNDVYSMKTSVGEGHPFYTDRDRAPQVTEPTKVGKKDGITSHYKNAALISIPEKALPTLVPNKTAASLPSLLDPTLYHVSASPRKQAKEAPGAVRSAKKPNSSDHYDSLARKKADPTYYNDSSHNLDQQYYNTCISGSCGSLALLVEDNEPDYDEVADEAVPKAKPHRGGSGKQGDMLCTTAGREDNCISVASESYEDMSGMEDFIESYKSDVL